MARSYQIARRSFLRGCGASALMLPLLRSIEARAQGLSAPLRFLIIHRPLGTQHVSPPSRDDLWTPNTPTSTTTFTLPASSAPFAPLQSKMVLIDGLNIVPASLQAGDSGGAYTAEGGMVAIMTGQPSLGRVGQQDHMAGGPSIDQIFLDRSPLLGGMASPSATKTRFQSLQLAADVRADRDEVAPRVMSYRPPIASASIATANQPMFPETQALDVYNRIFGASLPPEALERKQSVLDFARRDLARMRGPVPASETPKLDMYAGALAQLEAAIDALSPGAHCQRPPMPAPFAMTGVGATGTSAPIGGSRLRGVDYYDPADPNNHPFEALAQAHFAVIKAAFQCDLVRVATFMWAAATSWVVFPTVFQGATLGMPTGFQSFPIYPPSSTTNADTVAWYAQIDRYFSQQTSAFLQAMDATMDVDGNTLLDNTVVVYLSSLGRLYDRSLVNVPFLVFGGKNTRIKGGQVIKVTDGPLPTSGGAATGNRPTNDAWLALAPVFGVNMPSLGAPSQFTGPLPGLVS